MIVKFPKVKIRSTWDGQKRMARKILRGDPMMSHEIERWVRFVHDNLLTPDQVLRALSVPSNPIKSQLRRPMRIVVRWARSRETGRDWAFKVFGVALHGQRSTGFAPVPDMRENDFSGDREEWEDRVFDSATSFRVWRSGFQAVDCPSFASAIALAEPYGRTAIVYAVAPTGRWVAVPREDWARRAQSVLSRRPQLTIVE